LRTQSEILAEIDLISSKKHFLNVLLLLTHKNLNFFADELMTKNFREVLNENEISFLYGLWLKNKNKNIGIITKIEEVGDKVHNLMNELHLSFISSLNTTSNLSFYDSSVKNSHAIKETIFYAGSGAYDYQYCDFLENKYKYDEKWIRTKKIGRLKDFVNLFNYLKSATTN